MTDQSPKKQLIDRGPDNLLFWWLHFIHFIRWEWKFHKLSQIYTESDKLSFYKAPPGHLIRTKTVQTWFLRDSPGMFFSVCAGKTCNYQKKLFILQTPCFLLRRYRGLPFYSPQKKGRFIKWQFQVGIFPNPLLQKTPFYKQFHVWF